MKKSLFIFSFLVFGGIMTFAKEYPTAEQTTPDEMGWMQGFPPSQEKTLHARLSAVAGKNASRFGRLVF